ncbi:hypothetical protein [Brevibacillus brevis]|uniref:hypothetical protein n=1 Tax=Brevibacillus brevis TaxID=1393 RepID=UPI0007D8B79C|nr:hypothetical protein [Brevibacillus brevis]
MCLELFVMIRETPGIEPDPIVSPYVLTGKLSREKSPHFFRHFPKKQAWLVRTEEGCACRFSISKHPDKVKLGMYPEEERPRYYQEYVEDYQKREPVYSTIEDLFSPNKFRLDEQHYILTK